MTLSVGVVTNQRRRFVRASEVSELATEMKSYAKTLPGSVWVVDRRRDEVAAGKAVSVTPAGDAGISALPDTTSNHSANRSNARWPFHVLIADRFSESILRRCRPAGYVLAVRYAAE